MVFFPQHSSSVKGSHGDRAHGSGNFSNVKAVGQGVSEYKLTFGPGYRIYFGKDGNRLVILLGGGTKKRQSRDIENAQLLWKSYKQRKRTGE